jgi:hypothetical protein
VSNFLSRRRRMKKIIIILALCCFLLNANAAYAAFDDAFIVIGDLVVARPLGLVATVAGSAVFVVSLPFALTSGSVNKTANTLVGAPFRFTFERPLGDFKESGPLKPIDTKHKNQNTRETVPAEQE